MSREQKLAEILDECEHGSTAAFCSVCKANTRGGETVARQRRRAARNVAAWAVDQGLPYPSVTAEYRSLCKGHCDEYITEGDTIYRVDGEWLCHVCACDEHTMATGEDICS